MTILERPHGHQSGKLSDSACEVLNSARKHAARLGKDFIGVEDISSALAQDPSIIRMLKENGIDPPKNMNGCEDPHISSAEKNKGKIPGLDDSVAIIFERAALGARKRNDMYITPSDIFKAAMAIEA